MSNPLNIPFKPIGGFFSVDLARPLPRAGGGLEAFGATDLRTGQTDLMAVAVAPGAPARGGIMRDLIDGCPNLLHPLGIGPGPRPGGASGLYVICPAPPGPPLSLSTVPWTEAAVLARVLRPAAQVLCHLVSKGLTHRAIRPNNVFSAGPGQPITLGCAWAAPPAMHQPPAFEPFTSLMCDPAGRGDGGIADDVYALGCLLVSLVSGGALMAGLDDAAVFRRKQELGGFAAIASELRLPPLIADLARGMLAEDPDHRLLPAMLLDPAATRGRRVATRPSRRSQRPLTVGAVAVWDARGLAVAIRQEPELAARALRDGSVGHWLRRGLGDASLCSRVEELIRHHTGARGDPTITDAMLTMRVAALSDPLAPLCWHGRALWPDGLGALLAAHAGNPPALALLESMVATEAPSIWAAMRDDRHDAFLVRSAVRAARSLLRIRPPAGGIRRLVYTLNPLLPCAGVLGEGHCVAAITDVAAAMERVASTGGNPFDADALAFIAARSTRSLDMEAAVLATTENPPLAWLQIMTEIQHRYADGPLPGIARFVVARADPLLARWRNRDQRAAVASLLPGLAEAGHFAPLAALLDDPGSLEADANGVRQAAARVAGIDTALNMIRDGARARTAMAERLGQELTAGLGLTALAVTLLLTVLG